MIAKNKPLKELYFNEVIPSMMKEYNYKNELQVPKLSKVIINMGIGEGTRNSEIIDIHAKEMALIAGQKPVITKAKRSISNFKLREGMPVGVKVTLRGMQMYNFLYKLIHVVLPKLRDFRGLNPNSFDGRGNYSLGLPEQLVFPEMKADKVKRIQGMNIVVVTTSSTNEEARSLLKGLGMPFKKV